MAIRTIVSLAAALPVLLSAAELTSNRPVTFAKDIAPILQEKCQGCHREGSMAPMSLLTYEQVRPWAKSIAARVSTGTMPPWHSVDARGTFANDRRKTSRSSGSAMASPSLDASA